MAGILALALAPSGSVRAIRTLHADDFFCGEPIEIPYRTKGLPHGVATSFRCKDLKTFAQRISAKLGEDYETKQFNEDSLLIWQKKSSACYLVLRQTWKESWFLLFDMEAVLGEGAAKQSFVFPYHLLALMKSQGTLYYQFDPTVAYETVYSKQDFLAFYRRLGQYRIAETTDGFQIMRAHGLSSKTGTQDCGTITVPDRGLDGAVRFTFQKAHDKNVLYLSFVED